MPYFIIEIYTFWDKLSIAVSSSWGLGPDRADVLINIERKKEAIFTSKTGLLRKIANRGLSLAVYKWGGK